MTHPLHPYYHSDITLGNPVVFVAPDVQPGDMVVYQPVGHNGLISEANARVTRASSGGFVDLAHFFAGLDARTPQGAELTVPVASVPYATDGQPQTWHEVGA